MTAGQMPAHFADSRRQMLDKIAEMRALEQRATQASEKRLPVFRKRHQLSPRERVIHLLDPGMPFLRLHSLANYCFEDPDPDRSIPGGSIVCGIGYVSGTRVVIWADDSGINAGAMTSASLPMSLNLMRIALKQRLPLIHLVESAGANLLNYRVEGWASGGQLFRDLARLSAAGIPTISILHGGSTAGGAYMPGLSDYVIGVRKNGLAALGGAALVKAATGEVADDRDLGGSEMHAKTSGLVEYLADDDRHALRIARDVVASLHWNRDIPARERHHRPPQGDPAELAGIVPFDPKVAYDVRDILTRVVDDSAILEFKPRYGMSTLCAHAEIDGLVCGVIGNNGPIDPQGATKATQFIQLCDQSGTPLIFFNNTTGYLVGTEYEQAGMIKHGSKMIQAVSNVSVPKISLYVGSSFGAGNYGMCGLAYEPDFLFAWPNSISGVMGGEQAARTMTQVAIDGAKRRGLEPDMTAIGEREQQIAAHFKAQESAFYTSGRVLDHGVIDPRDTRRVLCLVLDICLTARQKTLHPNSFGVARM